MADRDPVGRMATVTGRIAPGEAVGAVTVGFGSITDSYLATAADGDVFDVGAVVVVVRRLPGKRVLVAAY